MGLLWELLKVIGMALFCLIVMFMTWSHIRSNGKGWDYDPTPGIILSWPKSRLLNWFVFHLFYLILYSQNTPSSKINERRG